MRRAAPIVLVLSLLACGGREAAPAPPASAGPPPSAASPPPGCTALPPELTSYDAITEGGAFSLALVRDDRGAWVPARPLAMPLHHASMIRWTDDAHLLDAQGEVRTLVVVATGLGRTALEHDETRGVFFATYGARVERVCPRDTSM